MNTQRGNTVMVGLAAAILAPKIERLTGYKPTLEDIGELFAVALIAWHGVLTAFERGLALFMRYYPPPSVNIENPTSPPEAAKS